MNINNMEPLLKFAEKVIKSQVINEEMAIIEFEKFFNCIIHGKDIINTYERRHVGIIDEEWNEAKEKFFNELGKVNEDHK